MDTRGKGYAPAIQTVPFRDPSCTGFGALFIYNTDTQEGPFLGALICEQFCSFLELRAVIICQVVDVCCISRMKLFHVKVEGRSIACNDTFELPQNTSIIQQQLEEEEE